MFFGRYHRRFRAVFLQRLSSGGPPSNLLVPVLRRSLRTHASCFYPAGRFRVNKLWPRKPQQNARWACRAAPEPPGFRDANSNRGYGGLRDVGYDGCSWSSTFTGSSAHYLGFNYGFLARMANKTPGGRAADFTLEPGRAQPSRGESISFLSPARAAGAPTFCHATESRQRTQPRGLPSLAKPSCGPPPAVLCKASSNLRVPSGTEPRPGWRWLAHSYGVLFLYLLTNSRPPTEKIRPRARYRSAREPGRLYPKLKTMTLQIAKSSAKFSAPSSAEFSQWRPPLPPAAGRNTPLHATRLRLSLAAAETL